MAVLIESSVWEPNPWLYVLIFSASLFSIALFSGFFAKRPSTLAGKASTVFDHGISPTLLRFQRNFLLLYHLVSVLESLGSTLGEFEFAHYGIRKDQILLYMCAGQSASLICGAFLGVFSDIMSKESLFDLLHPPCVYWFMEENCCCSKLFASSVCLSLSASIFSFSFKTWMVNQHDLQGHRRDTLNEVFWVMTFFESVSLIEGQVLSNWLIGNNAEKNISSPSIVVFVLAIIGILCITKGWLEVSQRATPKEYKMSFRVHIFGDKRILLLAWAQACLHFSTLVFWILWAPIVVMDGREMHLGLIYARLVGSIMLGSTIFPWLIGKFSSLRVEKCVVYAFSILGVILSVIAYDYQEVGVLLTLFCLFHVPYVPNQLRGGMISLSQAPAHAAMLFFLVQPGYYQNMSNATILAIAALGLFTAGCCMHMLRRLGKQPYQNGQKL